MPKIHVSPINPDYEQDTSPDNIYCFEEFTNSTSLHGIKHAFAPRHNLIRRWCWLVFVLGMAGALIFIVTEVAIDYRTYPFTTSVVISKVRQVDFPQVTLCSISPFNASLLNASTSLEKLLIAMSPLKYMTPPINISSDEFDFASETRTRKYFESISTRLKDTFLYCVFESVSIPCTDMFETRLTDMGMCFTTKSNTTMGHELRSTRMTGSEDGLHLSVFFDQDNYVHNNQMSAGFKVFLHESSEEPDTNNGFQIAPGFSTHAIIKKTKYSHLPSPYKAFGEVECLDTKNPSFQNPLEFSQHYDVTKCFKECRAKYIYKQCGCVGFVDLGNFTLCSLREKYNCYDEQQRIFRGKRDTLCNCRLPCESTSFESQQSISYSPSVLSQKYLAFVTDKDQRENFGEIRIFYEYLTETIVEQHPKYDLGKLAATLGGQMGIFLGASVLTVSELIEYVVIKLWCFLTCRKKKIRNNTNPGFEKPK